MSNKKISQLPESLTLSQADLMPIVTDGITKKITGNTLTNFTNQALNSLSGNWQSTYSTVKEASAFWNSVFSTVNTNSASWDSVFSDVNHLSSSWNSVFSSVWANSANWDSVFTSVSTTSANWNSVYSSVRANSATYALLTACDAKYFTISGGVIEGNLTVNGNLSSTGTQYFANTVFTTTSALSVINLGPTGVGLYVASQGTGDIASFYDLDQSVEVLHIGGQDSLYPNVGIKTSTPNKTLTVIGEISSTNTIWASGGNSIQWNKGYTIVESTSAKWSFTNEKIAIFSEQNINYQTNTFYAETQEIHLYTQVATGNFIVNVVGNETTSYDNYVPTNAVRTICIMNTSGGTAYAPTIKIDNVVQTVKWQGGQNAGNAVALDVWTFTIIKIDTNYYIVLGSISPYIAL